jgi:hypothetical protein
MRDIHVTVVVYEHSCLISTVAIFFCITNSRYVQSGLKIHVCVLSIKRSNFNCPSRMLDGKKGKNQVVDGQSSSQSVYICMYVYLIIMMMISII